MAVRVYNKDVGRSGSLLPLWNYGDITHYSGGVREPFLQAWQRNMSECVGGDVNIASTSGVYACVAIISQDVAKLPFNLMRLDDGFPSIDTRHPAAALLRKPNDYQTMMDYVQYHMANKLMTGNAYAYKELDARGVPRAIHCIKSDRVVPYIHGPSREIYYYIKDDGYDEAFMSADDLPPNRMVPARFMMHDRMNTMWHPLVGVSPIYAAAMAAMTMGRVMLNSEKFFANLSRPGGVLTSSTTITDVTADRLKREWKQRYSNGNLGETAVLGDGLSFSPISVDAVDSQLIEHLRWTVEDIARVFRVPMYLLADPSKASMRNSETLARAYYQGCLQYHIEGTERRFDRDLDLSAQYYTNFDLDYLFRMETDYRFESYQKAIQSGVLSINEARAKEGLKPVKGGEVPRIQMQYVPIDQPQPAPAPPPVAATPAAPAPSPSDDDEADEKAIKDRLRKAMFDTAKQEAEDAVVLDSVKHVEDCAALAVLAAHNSKADTQIEMIEFAV